MNTYFEDWWEHKGQFYLPDEEETVAQMKEKFKEIFKEGFNCGKFDSGY